MIRGPFPTAKGGRSVNKRVRGSRVAYWVLAWVFVVGVLIQVSFVGLAMFAGQPTWGLHAGFGHMVGTPVLAMLVLAFTGRLPRSTKLTTAVLFVLVLVQTEVFAVIKGAGSPFAAFHPVLAFVIFALATFLAQRARSLLREPLEGPVPSEPTAASNPETER